MEKQRFQRKQYLVEKAMQFRFARFVMGFVFTASLLSGLTIFYTTYFMLGERLADVYPQGRLVSIFQSVHIALFVVIILLLPVMFYLSILFSHRFAGPLPKIYRAIKDMGEGNFDVHLVLRKRDELKELAKVINEAAANLKARGEKPQGNLPPPSEPTS